MFLTLFVIFLILVLVFEANIAFINKKGLSFSVKFTIVVIVFLCAYRFYFEGSDYAKETKLFTLLLVYFIHSFVPLTLTFALAWFTHDYKKTTIHIIAIISSLIQTAIFPFFALMTVCFTGLDCL